MPRGNVGVLGSTAMTNQAIQQAQQTAPQQPAPQQQAQVAPVPGWGYFSQAQGIDYDPTSTKYGQDFLAGVKQYDPNAHFEQYEDGGGEGGPGQMKWRFQTDQSKMPWFGKNLVSLNDGDYKAQYYSPMSNSGDTFENFDKNTNGNFRGELYNPNMVGTVNGLGKVTDRRNVKNPMTTLDWLGPLLVTGFGGLMGGLGPIMSAARGVQGALRSGSPWDLAGAALPFMPGMNPILSQAAKFGINYMKRGG